MIREPATTTAVIARAIDSGESLKCCCPGAAGDEDPDGVMSRPPARWTVVSVLA